MGQVFSNLIGTCNCSSETKEEECAIEADLSNLKIECNFIKYI